MDRAWPATVHALKAVGLSILIELVATLFAAATWALASSPEPMTVILALGAAFAYGLSDFIGGVASRRTSVWPVAFTACLGAALGTVVLALFVPGDPTGTDFAWGLLAGVGSGVGTAFLYRGFARGRMGGGPRLRRRGRTAASGSWGGDR